MTIGDRYIITGTSPRILRCGAIRRRTSSSSPALQNLGLLRRSKAHLIPKPRLAPHRRHITICEAVLYHASHGGISRKPYGFPYHTTNAPFFPPRVAFLPPHAALLALQSDITEQYKKDRRRHCSREVQRITSIFFYSFSMKSIILRRFSL